MDTNEEYLWTDETELMMRCSQSELEVMVLKGRLSALESENVQLKQHIERLAMENSALIPKKRKISKEVTERWDFYHKNKSSVAKEKGLEDWRDVKRACDELFLRKQDAE